MVKITLDFKRRSEFELVHMQAYKFDRSSTEQLEVLCCLDQLTFTDVYIIAHSAFTADSEKH